MGLSSDLISQFVKVTKDPEPVNNEATVLGTTVEYNGKIYVKLDGSDLLTPVSSTADTKADERVTVLIKNHTATITGNISSPSARTDDVKEVADQISEFEIIIAHRVTVEELNATIATIESLKATMAKFENIDAVYAEIETLEALYTNTEHLTAKDIEAINAQIERIEAEFGNFTDISTEDLEAINANIGSLKAYTADFTYVSTEVLDAIKASIKQLETDKLSAKEAEITYANIDFANINEAAVQKIFSDSGIIKDLIVSEGKITGELVGVTIKGDIIEGGTVKADKLVVKGSDGLYHKLNIEAGATTSEEVSEEELQNGLHGTAIIAKSITAEKIAVDDLVAFGATIGGFHITSNSLYSGVKESATNTTRGVYLDNEGQLSVGDGTNYLKYYIDENGNYRLAISASDIILSATGKTIEETIEESSGNMEELESVKASIETTTEIINTLANTTEGISATVTSIQTETNKSIADVTAEISSLKEEVVAQITPDTVNLLIKTEMRDGSYNVKTTSGYTFDDKGLTVSRSDSEMKTQITDDGMTVSQNDEVVLTANNSGVDAKNLRATTYLIVGKNSRFEDYGNRTGCFWIGE